MALSIKLSFPYTFLDRVLAEFVLIPESKLKIFIHCVTPAIGLAVLALVLWRDIPWKADVWLVLLALFLFNPILIILGVGTNYFSSKSAREPFFYLFDESGIHVSAISHEFTHKWPAISRVKATRRYLLFFFAPGAAHCIPMSAVIKAGVLGSLLEFAREKEIKVVTR